MGGILTRLPSSTGVLSIIRNIKYNAFLVGHLPAQPTMSLLAVGAALIGAVPCYHYRRELVNRYPVVTAADKRLDFTYYEVGGGGGRGAGRGRWLGFTVNHRGGGRGARLDFTYYEVGGGAMGSLQWQPAKAACKGSLQRQPAKAACKGTLQWRHAPCSSPPTTSSAALWMWWRAPWSS
jgi:hypothetical protein